MDDLAQANRHAKLSSLPEVFNKMTMMEASENGGMDGGRGYMPLPLPSSAHPGHSYGTQGGPRPLSPFADQLPQASPAQPGSEQGSEAEGGGGGPATATAT